VARRSRPQIKEDNRAPCERRPKNDAQEGPSRRTAHPIPDRRTAPPFMVGWSLFGGLVLSPSVSPITSAHVVRPLYRRRCRGASSHLANPSGMDESASVRLVRPFFFPSPLLAPPTVEPFVRPISILGLIRKLHAAAPPSLSPPLSPGHLSLCVCVLLGHNSSPQFLSCPPSPHCFPSPLDRGDEIQGCGWRPGRNHSTFHAASVRVRSWGPTTSNQGGAKGSINHFVTREN
jgi:hypothetical protein